MQNLTQQQDLLRLQQQSQRTRNTSRTRETR